MKEIIFVTHNKGKIASAQKYLKNVNLKICEYDVDEPRSDDVREISKAKVFEAYKLVKKPCISLDAGFFINALNGFPKAFVNHALDTIGIEGILKLMEDKEDRSCSFKECLSYYDGENLYQFDGESCGYISNSILGNDTDKKWSDLWYIFIPKNYDKTLAQMTDEERNKRKTESKDGSTDAIKIFSEWYEENMN